MERWSQPREVVRETLSWKTLHKNRAGGMAEGVGPEFKPQYKKKKKNHKNNLNTELTSFTNVGTR
jgi:hypothetical protein